ncbi:MAG: GvpL/GvpF family gas vesicle protein [Chloroflexi bacterium]|nr:GvpL/GvpF family gas vesicle protein [Chloroflexota bacterium]
MTATIVYLYAVAAPPAAKWAAQGSVTGVEGARVRAIDAASLVALVSDVPEAMYDQPALDEHVRDGEWLNPRATTHQTVNAAAHAAIDAVLPVPFGTIYRTDDRVKEMLRERADELQAKLASVRGRSEWVIALHRDASRAAEHLAQVREAVEPDAVASGTGRGYLEHRRGELALREELRGFDAEAATAAQHAIERVSRVSFAEPVPEDGDVAARTTYVVRRTDEERMGHAVEGFNADWAERGYTLRATGPWPPYRSSGGELAR